MQNISSALLLYYLSNNQNKWTQSTQGAVQANNSAPEIKWQLPQKSCPQGRAHGLLPDTVVASAPFSRPRPRKTAGHKVLHGLHHYGKLVEQVGGGDLQENRVLGSQAAGSMGRGNHFRFENSRPSLLQIPPSMLPLPSALEQPPRLHRTRGSVSSLHQALGVSPAPTDCLSGRD